MKLPRSIFVGLILVSLAPLQSLAGPVWTPVPTDAYAFGKRYPEAQGLLFAFDYGHALVYERLLLNKGTIADPEAFEKSLLQQILTILKNPPSVKVDEEDIAPEYVYKFPLMVTLFDWSHLLHQYIYDALATSKDRGAALTARVNVIFAHYNAKSQVAVTNTCKSMLFMDGHYFSKAFRRTYPSFNLLIWSYHWFQIRLYEALLAPTQPLRDLAVAQTVKDFWALIGNLPDSAEFDMMPATAAEAPTFAKRFPQIPPAFDNVHMLHDIVSDLLTSNKVLASAVPAEELRLGAMALDPKAFANPSCQ